MAKKEKNTVGERSEVKLERVCELS
ncbi:hypothetical protein OIU76_017814 [Salix suchowensis]|nr:hypothetical protein OIU76_017814 [Salix suchowensis]